jgi:hypothetical protein
MEGKGKGKCNKNNKGKGKGPAVPPPPIAGAKVVNKWGDPIAAVAVDEWLAQTAAAPIFGVDWHTIDRLQLSETGSAGVVFARCSSGAFVVKASSACGQEFTAGLLGHVLGVPVPR